MAGYTAVRRKRVNAERSTNAYHAKQNSTPIITIHWALIPAARAYL